MQNLFSIIASVLHLGNIRFEADGRGYASINNDKELHWVSKVKAHTAFTLCAIFRKNVFGVNKSFFF